MHLSWREEASYYGKMRTVHCICLAAPVQSPDLVATLWRSSMCTAQITLRAHSSPNDGPVLYVLTSERLQMEGLAPRAQVDESSDDFPEPNLRVLIFPESTDASPWDGICRTCAGAFAKISML